MRRLALFVAAAAALAAAVGCTKHQTEMILVVTTEGVRIPEDVHKIHLTVQDHTAALDDTVYDADVELCNPMLSTNCFNIPVTADLYPGKMRGGDSVRVQVDAIGATAPVISDAALFTFADQQSLRLDFVLYGNCLGNVSCAERNQACGPLDTCIDVTPGPAGNGPLDLALPPPDDLAVPPPDLTMVDLKGADLTTTPPDLTSTLDLAGCASVTCPPNQQCVAGQCQACGGLNQPCCFGPVAPNPNAGSTGGTGTCSQTNLECNGNVCVNCGNTGELCCSMMNPSCFAPNDCNNNICVLPPPPDMSMLPDDMAMESDDMALHVVDGGITQTGDMFF